MLSVGERTIGVLTKIDLMDKGTDAVDVSHFICFVLKPVLFDNYGFELRGCSSYFYVLEYQFMVIDYRS